MFTAFKVSGSYPVGGCQNYGPFLGTLNIRCPERDHNFDNHPCMVWASLCCLASGASIGPFAIWEFPTIRGTLLGGPYNKDPAI